MSAWTNSKRRESLPSDWSKIRNQVGHRDAWRCQVINEDGKPCLAPSNEVDHIKPGNDHRLSNLRCICRWHHKHKSSSEGGFARAARAKAKSSLSTLPVEKHPGLL